METTLFINFVLNQLEDGRTAENSTGVYCMKDVRIIKRYQNRKLYDTFQSCYVTLEEIAQIIRDGHEIKVIDNKSKNDITYMTQIQLLFDQERKTLKPSDSNLLKRVVRSEAGTLSGYIKTLEAKLDMVFPEDQMEVAQEEESTIEKPAEEYKPFISNPIPTQTTTIENTTSLN